MMHQNKKLYQFILIIFGIVMLIAFIWFRFLRSRLPKEIPLSFSLFGFLIVLNICCIYIYILISLFRKPTPMNPILKGIIDYIFLPLETLDLYFKDLPYIRKYYKKFLVLIIPFLKYCFVSTNVFYYAFEILPRIILVTVLFIDIFGYHELYFIYKFLLLAALILLGKYIKYSLKYAKDHFIASLQDQLNIIMDYEYAIQVVDIQLPKEDSEDFDIPETMVVPLKMFIDFQTITFIKQKEYYSYMIVREHYDNSYYTEKNLPQPRKFTREEFDTRIKNILQLALLVAHYDLTHNSNPNVKTLRCLIFSNYLICWLYILLISLPSLYYASFWELWIIFGIQETQDPFSLTNLTSTLVTGHLNNTNK